jgi:Flp pilus assembly protein TadB
LWLNSPDLDAFFTFLPTSRHYLQPGYAEVLFYDPSGIAALKLAIGLDLMAFFTIRRILKVDF